jgi:threonine dehydratase
MTKKPKRDLNTKLVEEILRARERIYHVNKPTPLEKVRIDGIDADIFLKREDLSAINAYKWRGAYNAIAVLPESAKKKPVIAASAGNHAQGVALAARLLGLKSKIYMPRSTPMMKQTSVKKHGQDTVEIILHGDTYNDAADEAIKQAKLQKTAFIHPFDDLHVIAGQATIGDEIVLSGQGAFDMAFIQIGGGGLAAGVSSWLKIHYPHIKIIGVEGEGQASMLASIKAGKPVTLDQVDTFCDGTAVRRPGDLTFDICRDTLDEIITVSNEEVCAAIETTWSIGRFIPEPSGAMSLAGLIKYASAHPKAVKGKKLVAIICGANMDFSKLRIISANAATGANRRKFLRFELDEKGGSLLSLIRTHFADINITAFHYGKVSDDAAYPVIAFEATPEKFEDVAKRLKLAKVKYEDITGAADMRYRVINYNPRLFRNPLFLHVDFPERKGALRELLKAVSPVANICYFNYFYTGEEIGRALMGFELKTPDGQDAFMDLVAQTPATCRLVDAATQARMLYCEG